jgi:hypothetical protein
MPGSILDRYVSISYDPGINTYQYAKSWIIAEPVPQYIQNEASFSFEDEVFFHHVPPPQVIPETHARWRAISLRLNRL